MGKDVIIAAGVRTAVGKFMGSLSNVAATELGKIVIGRLLEITGMTSSSVDEVIMGNVLQSGLGQNPARQSAAAAGIPYECPAFTVNKVCGSGLKSVALGVSEIMLGRTKVVVAGGMENMSMAPFYIRGARRGYRLGQGVLEDSIISEGLCDAFNDVHMGLLAEHLAEVYDISRDDQDTFACKSQLKYMSAFQEGKFHDEIVPVRLEDGDFLIDEHPREPVLEKLKSLKPSFRKDGTVTAGNSSGINDAAAALLIAEEDEARRLSLPVMARVLDYVSVGLEPKIMGMGAGEAIKKLLKRNNVSLADVDLFEINEAFASQMIAVLRDLNLDEEKVNVNGGSIALGHPIGASGSRIMVTLIHELAKRSGRLGVASLCIGGGMGIAMLVERG